MLTTANIHELENIVFSRHQNPHSILGLHNVFIGGKNKLAIRAFDPFAKNIVCINTKTKERYNLEQIHLGGFFEAIIEEDAFFEYFLEKTTHENHTYIQIDPYSFLPQISELDCFLFNQGNHYKIYEKLGAHIKTINGTKGVSFGVWAPSAIRVSVIGNFNNWDGRIHQMRMLGSSGIFEIFIPNIGENEHYKFEIKTKDETIIEKQDPYANFNELRPSHSSLVSDITNYTWNDKNYIDTRKSKDILNAPINIYEVHLGSWRKPEDPNREFLSYLELIDTLIPYVLEMGYTHIELLPIMEHPFDASWGYQVTGYYAVTSRYGSPTEFKQFIDACHQNGIGVILDWVPAHFPKDAHALAKFDGSNLYEHANPLQGEHPQWGTLIFNYGRNEVKNFLIANALFWLEEYHVDGLRVDAVASMLYLDYCREAGQWEANKYGGRENIEAVEFIKHLNSIIRKEHPDTLICAEESTSWPFITKPAEENGLGFNLKWNMGWMNDFLAYIEEDPINRKYHHNKLTFGMMYNNTENFILVLSHDEVVHGKKSMLDKMPGDLWRKCANLRLSFGFMFGYAGKKLNFMGHEIGQFIEWDEKRPLDFFLLEYEHHRNIKSFVKDLNHLYLNERAFWYRDFGMDGFNWISCDDKDQSILIFERKAEKKNETLIFICNFTPNTYEDYKFNMPYECSFTEILNSDNKKYGGSDVTNKDFVFQTKKTKEMENAISVRIAPLSTIIFKVNK